MRAALQFVLLCTFVIKEAFTSGDRICPKDGQPWECCPNYFEVNGTCVECPLGRFGINCTYTCPSNRYGRRCTQLCNCSVNYTCDSADGCVPIVKGDRGQGGDLVTGDDDVQPGIWATLVILLALCVSGSITLVVILIKRKHAVHKIKTENIEPVHPYAVQNLNNLNEIDENDTEYAEIVRDVTKIDQNYKPSSEPVSDGNIYSTNVSEVPYDKLQFHPKSTTILKDHELEQYSWMQKVS